ncbi:hypothetical protein C1752_00559 [Acaryochloris thomasi RCC1774]|uniref:PhoD-like phosphatase metallophosphatase domain-containing protein n=1 Tax=Acaryochloris thomasi RCC1774 TaxID=1764569 RepID=A0A2W1JXE4_9CYAN|nr:hypothetical protein C1752_00559 [Acaryochloris thomasi RCC1774]
MWVALSKKSVVTLNIYLAGEQGRKIQKMVARGQGQTIQMGRQLHLVAVTAAVLQTSLQPGQIYAYDLEFLAQGTQKSVSLRTEALLEQGSLSYFSHHLPTFVLPPVSLDDLKIVHGSCRKPHGGGPDILPLLDDLLIRDAHLVERRPHQLFLTGDQIYGDDVADPFLWIAIRLGPVLLGWEEMLPVDRFENGTFDYYSPKLWPPGERTEIARQKCGLTAMLHNSPETAKSHLFSFAEYCIAYLLAWSPVLWPEPEAILDANSLHGGRSASKRWSQDAADMQTFVHGVAQVRRALANVPTYMICDDHDISDDWYLNHNWCNRVLSQPLGRCVVQNGLLAYALFQAWGNTPEQFVQNQPGASLLKNVEQWSLSRGTDQKAWRQIGRYVGMPLTDEQTGQPRTQTEEEVLILERDPEALSWFYTIRSDCHEVLVLDTRTWRGYPKDTEKIAPPMLLCPSAFRQQIEAPLRHTDALNQRGAKIRETLIVLPTNLVSLSIIDAVQQYDFQRGKVFDNDVGDAWNFHEGAFTQLLSYLSTYRDRVILLSGDIHYGSTIRLDHWTHDNAQAAPHSSVIVQLTSSAMKNAELATYLVHTRLKSLFPESAKARVGWRIPPVENSEAKPDWQYQVRWIPRQKAQATDLPPTHRWSQRSRSLSLLQVVKGTVSWLWRNRWFQEGSEVVGHNNFGVVTWAKTETRESATIVHDIYWYPPWDMTRPVKSQYRASLAQATVPPISPVLYSKY